MAEKKATHVVIDGCIQEGRKTFLKGEFYTPPTKELAVELESSKVIAAIRTPEAQAVLQQSTQLSLVPGAGGVQGDADAGGQSGGADDGQNDAGA